MKKLYPLTAAQNMHYEWIKGIGCVCHDCFTKHSWRCPVCNTFISNDHTTCWQCELNSLLNSSVDDTANMMSANIEIPF